MAHYLAILPGSQHEPPQALLCGRNYLTVNYRSEKKGTEK